MAWSAGLVQAQLNRLPVRAQRLRLGFVLLLVILVAGSNLLACFIHCWTHTHPVPLATVPPQVEQHTEHATPRLSMETVLPTDQQTDNPHPLGGAFCRHGHEAPSPFTVAVLLPLLLVRFWLAPGFTMPAHSLSFRLLEHPPPRRPPRFYPAFL